MSNIIVHEIFASRICTERTFNAIPELSASSQGWRFFLQQLGIMNMSGKCGIEEVVAKVTSLGNFTPSPGCKKLTSNQEKLLRKAIEKALSSKTETNCENDCFCIFGPRKKEGSGTKTISVSAGLKDSGCTYTGTPKVKFTTYVTKGFCVPKKIEGIKIAFLTEQQEALMDVISVTMLDASSLSAAVERECIEVQEPIIRDLDRLK